MSKNFTFILIFLFGLNFSYGQQVNESAAKEIGKNFLSGRTGSGGRVSELELVYKVSSKTKDVTNVTTSETYFYVFNAQAESSFVIVSGDERALPILAYSDENSFDPNNIPPNVAKWLEGYKNELRHLIREKKEPTETIRQQWRNLKSGQIKNKADARTKSVGPLIQTTWNQSPHYNALAPDNSVTGCVATAMAQIMKYWNYPANGTGFHSYNHSSYGTLSANFGGTVYDWSSMPTNVTGSNNAVATLMYHCGVSVDMDYSPQVSGAYVISSKSPVTHCSEYALKTYFGYKSTLQGIERADHTETQWVNKLVAELDGGRPILYAGFGSGGGHAFVCDGYDANSFFHFNWGWGGIFDGYFQINALDPDGTGIGGGTGGYNSGHQAVIGIEPPTGVTTFNMSLHDDVMPSATTIAYGQAFTVSTNIINNGSTTFTGDYSAAVFDNAYNFVGFVETLSGYSLQSGFVYSNNLIFSTTGILSMLPGTYYVAIYYRPTGGDWAQVAGGSSFTNLVEMTVVNDNDISLNAAMVVTPGTTLTQGEPAAVNLNIRNDGTTTFTGIYDVSLYNLDGSHAQTINTITENSGLPGGFTYNSPFLTFSTTSITVEPGTYLLAIQHNPDATGWQLTGTGNFQNPITVTVAAPPIAPDSYEDNDAIPKAFNLPVTFSGTSVTKTTSGSNCHTGSDYDYYKIALPDGYEYSISARLHDAYNSSNGNTYTLDALVSWSADGSTWSDAYDDIISDAIEIDGPKTLYFHVAPYFAGETGTYLLDIEIERALIIGVEETVTNDLVNVYPNPASKILLVDISKINESVKSIALHNIRGTQVFNTTSLYKGTVEVPVLDLADGFYFLQFRTEKGLLTKKIIIKK